MSTSPGSSYHGQTWPEWRFDEGKDTCATLHMWTQIAGKIRLAQSPWLNHSWHVTFYLTARGMTSSPVPCGMRTFEIDFDFIDHQLRILTSDGMTRTLALRPRPVADFYRELFVHLTGLGFDIKIHAKPNEVIDAIPFEQDHVHASYDAEYVNRLWRILAQADRVFKQFRSGFIGKCSPVHFFWGGFDLAVTRFSGRTAPQHPGGIPNCPDWVMQEAYSHELSSCGFWPGNDGLPYPVFYAYAYPEPPGFNTAQVRPDEASYNKTFGEFILPYAVVQQSQSPDAMLLEFLQSTYDATANLGKWDRAALEKGAPIPLSRH
ncbi:MAG: DUF5996 family protein [Pseudomonadota bacterium]